MNGLNPRKYLEWLLTEMPNADGDLEDDAFLDAMMPWSGGLPAELYLSPKAAEEAARMADDPIVDIDPEAFPDEDRENS